LNSSTCHTALLIQLRRWTLTLAGRIVALSTLDVSYVSSVSWYFLVSFGMRGFLSLILGEKSGTRYESMHVHAHWHLVCSCLGLTVLSS